MGIAIICPTEGENDWIILLINYCNKYKQLKCKPYPMTKINEMLQKIEVYIF